MNNVIVNRFQVIGTNYIVYQAWEPCPSIMNAHSSITHFGDALYGKITSRPLPEHFKAMMPGSNERSKAVREWYQSLYAESIAAILAKYPHLDGADIRIDDGEIEEYFADKWAASEALK